MGTPMKEGWCVVNREGFVESRHGRREAAERAAQTYATQLSESGVDPAAAGYEVRELRAGQVVAT